MNIRKLSLAITLAGRFASAQAVTEIQWWHAMTGPLNDKVNELAEKFNASQTDRLQGGAGIQGELRRDAGSRYCGLLR